MRIYEVCTYCHNIVYIPDVTVHVISEEDTQMTSAKVSALRLKIINRSDSNIFYQHPADTRNKNDPGGVFTFR